METTAEVSAVDDGTPGDTEVTVTKGLLVRIEAKPGRGDEVEAHIKAGLATILEEPDTTAWLAIRLGPTSFAVVDAFPHEEGRQFHLEAGRARLSKDSAMELFAEPPSMTYTDIVAAKLPG
jgi:quinol monooxygenase YgiN